MNAPTAVKVPQTVAITIIIYTYECPNSCKSAPNSCNNYNYMNVRKRETGIKFTVLFSPQEIHLAFHFMSSKQVVNNDQILTSKAPRWRSQCHSRSKIQKPAKTKQGR